VSRHVIIALGGTGQAVLHHYNQLYLLNVVECAEPYFYHAIVVDTDELNANVALARDFFSALRVGTEPGEGAGGRPVPTIDYIQVGNRAEDEVSNALTGLPLGDLLRDQPRHPVGAFFSADALVQKVQQGLYARPALSTVISRDWTHDGRLALHDDSKVVVVSSVIGGTGGGLLAPLLATLGKQCNNLQGVRMRAVVFGEYFNPDSGGIDANWFSSNQALGIRSLEEVEEAIEQFAIVGFVPDERMDERHPSAERSGWNLPWPRRESYPFWRGAEMLNDLLLDSDRARQKEFRDREVGTDEVPPDRRLKLTTAEEHLRLRVSRAKALVVQEAVRRMHVDPFAKWVWGSSLVRTVADFWKMTIPSDKSFELDERFCGRLQAWLDKWWEGRPACVSGLFPEGMPEAASLRSIRKINWPRLDAAKADRMLFGGPEEVARRAAATLIWCALRG
jgi:hypothetical protein